MDTFGSGPGFVSQFTSGPGFVNPVRVLSIWSDPIQSGIQEVVLASLNDPYGTVRIIIATTALGMGVDIKGLHRITNYGPPSDIESYIQELESAGRDTQKLFVCFLAGSFITVHLRCWNTGNQAAFTEASFLNCLIKFI